MSVWHKTARSFARHLSRSCDAFLREGVRRDVREAGLWFVDIPRTSSTSVKVELAERFGTVYGKQYERETGSSMEKEIADHESALSMREYLGWEVWSGVFTFSIVRNPWDRFLSLYRYRVAAGDFGSDITFDRYVKKLHDVSYIDRSSPYVFPGYHKPMCDYLLDEKGELLVDKVYRLEQREEMVSELSSKFDLLGSDSWREKLSEGDGYRRSYTDETAELVGRFFYRDADYFGYEF